MFFDSAGEFLIPQVLKGTMELKVYSVFSVPPNHRMISTMLNYYRR
jgi:hypothetical protein